MSYHTVHGTRQSDKPWIVGSPRDIENVRADVLQNLLDRENDLEVRKMNLEIELEQINEMLAEIEEHIKFAQSRYDLCGKDKLKKSDEIIEF